MKGKKVGDKGNPPWAISVKIKNKSKGLIYGLRTTAQARDKECQLPQGIVLLSPQISMVNKQRLRLAGERTISMNTL